MCIQLCLPHCWEATSPPLPLPDPTPRFQMIAILGSALSPSSQQLPKVPGPGLGDCRVGGSTARSHKSIHHTDCPLELPSHKAMLTHVYMCAHTQPESVADGGHETHQDWRRQRHLGSLEEARCACVYTRTYKGQGNLRRSTFISRVLTVH